MTKTLLLLTGGGHIDFYPALYTLVNGGRERGYRILGSLDGWDGIEKGSDRVVNITHYPIEKFQNVGGSFLGSSRIKPALDRVSKNLRKYNVDVVVALGGEDTLGVASELYRRDINVLGWPKTMDNDLSGTYATVGYPTAAYRAARATLEAFDIAYTQSRIFLATFFGRATDWIPGAATAYGHADYAILGESEITLAEVADGLMKALKRNETNHNRSFGVVVVSENASRLKGLEPYYTELLTPEEISYDSFGHPKLEPDLVGRALIKALSETTRIKRTRFASQSHTYSLRDGKLIPIDEVFAVKTAKEVLRLIDEENFGRMAAIQDPRISGYWPVNDSQYISANGTTFVVSNTPFEEALQPRPVKGTGLINYETSMPTSDFDNYLHPLLGEKPENPRIYFTQFPTAQLERELVTV